MDAARETDLTLHKEIKKGIEKIGMSDERDPDVVPKINEMEGERAVLRKLFSTSQEGHAPPHHHDWDHPASMQGLHPSTRACFIAAYDR